MTDNLLYPERLELTGPGGFAVHVKGALNGRPRMHVAGDLDIVTADFLLQLIRNVAQSGCRRLDLDLAEVRFCDVAGLRALLTAQQELQDAGSTLTVHDPCPSLQYLLRLFDRTNILDPDDELRRKVPANGAPVRSEGSRR